MCPACFNALPWIDPKITCERCALEVSSPGVCGACQTNPKPYQSLRAWLHYTALSAHLLKQFKYQRSMLHGRWWLEFLKIQYWSLPQAFHAAHWITVPIHYRRYWVRGFNQTDWLLRGLNRALKNDAQPGINILYPLEKIAHTVKQSTRSKQARQSNVGVDLWRWRKNISIPEHIVIFEDVVTTGSTLRAVTEVCLQAGVKRVDAVALMRVV